MTIKAFNSGAKVWLADMEDASTAAWPTSSRPDQPAARPQPPLDFTSPEGRSHALPDDRAWHNAASTRRSPSCLGNQGFHPEEHATLVDVVLGEGFAGYLTSGE
jgi:hypothetical protein